LVRQVCGSSGSGPSDQLARLAQRHAVRSSTLVQSAVRWQLSSIQSLPEHTVTAMRDFGPIAPMSCRAEGLDCGLLFYLCRSAGWGQGEGKKRPADDVTWDSRDQQLTCQLLTCSTRIACWIFSSRAGLPRCGRRCARLRPCALPGFPCACKKTRWPRLPRCGLVFRFPLPLTMPFTVQNMSCIVDNRMVWGWDGCYVAQLVGCLVAAVGRTVWKDRRMATCVGIGLMNVVTRR
jgi:hypothetical protein